MGKRGEAKPKKAKPKKERATQTAAPAVTIEQLDDSQLQVLFFQHKREIKSLRGQLDLAKDHVKTCNKALRAAFEIAEKEGISKDELELAIKLESDEGRKELERRREREERVTRWLGEPLGAQGDLVRDAHGEAGERAALSDEPKRPPTHLSQHDMQSWMEGYDRGVAKVNAQRAGGFRPLGDQPSTMTRQ